MNRAKNSYEWERWERKLKAEGFEIFTRFASPDIIHKAGEPFRRENTYFVFYRKKNGRFSIHQQQGMKILADLGLKLYRWPEKGGV